MGTTIDEQSLAQMMSNHESSTSFQRYRAAYTQLKGHREAEAGELARKLRNNELLFTQVRYDESVTDQWLSVIKIGYAILLVTVTVFMVSPAVLKNAWLVYIGYVLFMFAAYLYTRASIGVRSKLNFNHRYFRAPLSAS